MKTIKSALLYALLASALAQGAASQAAPDYSGYSADMKDILERGRLIVAMTKADQPPFYFVDDKGGLKGLDVDLGRAAAKELFGDEAKVEFLRTAADFNAVVDQVARKEADVAVSKLSQTFARAKRVLFTAPYITFRRSLLFNRLALAKATSEEALPAFVRALKGKVGVLKGSYSGYAKANFPGAEVVEFDKWDAAVAAVLKGEVLALYRDELEVQKILSGTPDPILKDALKDIPDPSLKLKAVILTDLVDPIAMAVAWDRPLLRDWFDILLERYPVRMDVKGLLDHYMPAKTDAEGAKK